MTNDLATLTSNGPAMRALNDNQRAFIWALLDSGDGNVTKAYMSAYPNAGTYAACQANGSRMSHQPKILMAMREEALNRLHAGVITATSELMKIAAGQDTAAKPSDRLKAISMVLNRAGLHELTEHKISVEHSVATDKEMVARIKTLAAEMGLDAQKLLGNAAGVIDAEFTEVYTDEDPNDISDLC